MTSLSAPLIEALTRLASQPTILLALDFDGTLSPFVDDPSTAAPLPGSVESLRILAALPGVHVGYLSGRPVADLRARVRAPSGALFVGSHGAETDLGSSVTSFIDLNAEESAELAGLRRDLKRELGDMPGIRFEDKPAGLVVHFREADDINGVDAAATASRVHERHPRFKLTDGHQVVEFALRHATKGDGIAVLREHVHPDAMMFIGDDTTDEDAFAVLSESDVSIKVGPGDTLARFRVETPESVEVLLGGLANLRRERDGTAEPQ